MRWDKDDFWITDDADCADIEFITRSLNTTYWAGNRSMETVKKSVANSILLSLFNDSTQVAFCRIVSDHATFAWLCDLYVEPDFRGRGLGKWLVDCALQHLAFGVNVAMLATADAHGLYEKFGFHPADCDKVMVRLERDKN